MRVSVVDSLCCSGHKVVQVSFLSRARHIRPRMEMASHGLGWFVEFYTGYRSRYFRCLSAVWGYTCIRYLPDQGPTILRPEELPRDCNLPCEPQVLQRDTSKCWMDLRLLEKHSFVGDK